MATKYKADFPRLAEEACGVGGLTYGQLAKVLDVSVSAVTTWRKTYPEFDEAINRGHETFALTGAEKSLQKRLLGYFYNEVMSTLVKDKVTGEMLMQPTKITKKHIPADTNALKFYLRNRARKRWPDKQELDVNFTKKLSDTEIDKSISLIVDNIKKKAKHAARR